jgi:glycine cleavage system H protein
MYPEELLHAEHEWVRSTDAARWCWHHRVRPGRPRGHRVRVASRRRRDSLRGAALRWWSPRRASATYAPLAGEVIGRNSALDAAPEIVNTDPYGEGWMVEVRPVNPTDIDGLLSAADYRALVEKA